MARPTIADGYSGSGSNATTGTWNLTVVNNGITTIEIQVYTEVDAASAPARVTGITVADDAAIFAIQKDQLVGGKWFNVEIWYVLSAGNSNGTGTGTNPVVVTFDTTATKWVGISKTIKNPRQRGPEATAYTLTPSASSTTHTVDLTTVEAFALISAAICVPNGLTITAGTGTTKATGKTSGGATASDISGASINMATSIATNPAGTYTLTATTASIPSHLIIVAVAWSQNSPQNFVQPIPLGQMIVGKSIGDGNAIIACSPIYSTITRQWYRRDASNPSGAAIAGATSSTYTLQSADDSVANPGTTVFVRFTPSISSPASTALPFDSADVTCIGPAGTAVMSVNGGPTHGQFYPHDLGVDSISSINVTANYANCTPVTVEYRIVNASGNNVIPSTNGTYTAFPSPTISAGNITNVAYANVPVGGPYRAEWRLKDGSGTVLVTHLHQYEFYVGDTIVWIGSSTPERAFVNYLDPAPSSIDGTARAWSTANGTVGHWVPVAYLGAGARGAADRLRANSNRPFGFIPTANGGTKLHNYNAAAGTGWCYTGDLNGDYPGMITTVTNAVGSGKIVHAVFCKSDSVTTASNYAPDAPSSAAAEVSDLRQLATNIRTAGSTGLGNSSVPIFFMIEGLQPVAADYARYNFARTAESIHGDDSGSYVICNLNERFGTDGSHPNATNQYSHWANAANAYLDVVLGVNKDWRAPRLVPGGEFTNFSDNGSVATCNANFEIFGGSGIVSATGTTTGITGFEFSNDDFATTLSISVAITGSRTCQVTLPTGTPLGTLKGRYMYINDDAQQANCIFDDSTTS